MLLNFSSFINERYEAEQAELVKKIQKEALKPQKNMSLPLHLNDHAILALADDPSNTDIFVELLINGENVCLEYGDEEGEHEVCYVSNNYENVVSMLKQAYSDWQKKVEELHLSEDDISIDELSKSNL